MCFVLYCTSHIGVKPEPRCPRRRQSASLTRFIGSLCVLLSFPFKFYLDGGERLIPYSHKILLTQSSYTRARRARVNVPECRPVRKCVLLCTLFSFVFIAECIWLHFNCISECSWLAVASAALCICVRLREKESRVLLRHRSYSHKRVRACERSHCDWVKSENTNDVPMKNWIKFVV